MLLNPSHIPVMTRRAASLCFVIIWCPRVLTFPTRQPLPARSATAWLRAVSFLAAFAERQPPLNPPLPNPSAVVIGSIAIFLLIIVAICRFCCRTKNAAADSSTYTQITVNPQAAYQPNYQQHQQQSYQAPPQGYQQPYQAAPGAPSPQFMTTTSPLPGALAPQWR